MRPLASTAAASANTSPTPPIANLARWAKCQSLASPSVAEYWHIGEMTTRFLRVTPRSDIGVNKSGLDAMNFLSVESTWAESILRTRSHRRATALTVKHSVALSKVDWT